METTILFKDAEEETLLTYSDEIENRIRCNGQYKFLYLKNQQNFKGV